MLGRDVAGVDDAGGRRGVEDEVAARQSVGERHGREPEADVERRLQARLVGLDDRDLAPRLTRRRAAARPTGPSPSSSTARPTRPPAAASSAVT